MNVAAVHVYVCVCVCFSRPRRASFLTPVVSLVSLEFGQFGRFYSAFASLASSLKEIFHEPVELQRKQKIHVLF